MGEELQAAVRDLVGDDVHVIGSTDRGESKSTYLVDSSLGELVLKVTADGPGALANQQRLVRLVEALRARGYPAPEYVGVGHLDRVVFTLQRRIARASSSSRGLVARRYLSTSRASFPRCSRPSNFKPMRATSTIHRGRTG